MTVAHKASTMFRDPSTSAILYGTKPKNIKETRGYTVLYFIDAVRSSLAVRLSGFATVLYNNTKYNLALRTDTVPAVTGTLRMYGTRSRVF